MNLEQVQRAVQITHRVGHALDAEVSVETMLAVSDATFSTHSFQQILLIGTIDATHVGAYLSEG